MGLLWLPQGMKKNCQSKIEKKHIFIILVKLQHKQLISHVWHERGDPLDLNKTIKQHFKSWRVYETSTLPPFSMSWFLLSFNISVCDLIKQKLQNTRIYNKDRWILHLICKAAKVSLFFRHVISCIPCFKFIVFLGL